MVTISAFLFFFRLSICSFPVLCSLNSLACDFPPLCFLHPNLWDLEVSQLTIPFHVILIIKEPIRLLQSSPFLLTIFVFILLCLILRCLYWNTNSGVRAKLVILFHASLNHHRNGHITLDTKEMNRKTALQSLLRTWPFKPPVMIYLFPERFATCLIHLQLYSVARSFTLQRSVAKNVWN